MLQSNLQQLTGPTFKDHTISKWKFYFDLTSISYDELIKTDDIILSIKKTLPNYSLALLDVIDKLTNSTLTTREKFHALTYKRESLILFPHIFTSIKYDFKFESDEEEIFYISQLSWEILGISTQIIHIENNLEAIKHIKNIEFHLKESVFNSAYAQDQSLKILKLIEKLNHYFLTEY